MATATTGATVWQKLTASHLTGTGNSFGAQLLHIQETAASGVNGTALASATWTARVLNSLVTNEITGASLGSSQITLPAGTFFVKAEAAGSITAANGSQRLKLYNVTDAADTLLGINSGKISAGVTNVTAGGRFVLAAAKVLELRHFTSVGTNGAGGLAQSNGTETYAEVFIWKVA